MEGHLPVISTSNGVAEDLAKFRSREVGSSNCRVAKQFDIRLCPGPAETPVRLQKKKQKTIDIDLAA